MHLPSRIVLLAVCSALTLAAAPLTAQATPLGSGGGAFVANNQALHWFAFTCETLPDGSVTGQAAVLEPSTQSLVVMQITSAAIVGGDLFVAGPALQVTNDAPFLVGQTLFFGVDDDPTGDAFAGVSAVPLVFGNLTIQQILAIVGPPPPGAFSRLLLGDVRIF